MSWEKKRGMKTKKLWRREPPLSHRDSPPPETLQRTICTLDLSRVRRRCIGRCATSYYCEWKKKEEQGQDAFEQRWSRSPSSKLMETHGSGRTRPQPIFLLDDSPPAAGRSAATAGKRASGAARWRSRDDTLDAIVTCGRKQKGVNRTSVGTKKSTTPLPLIFERRPPPRPVSETCGSEIPPHNAAAPG